MASVPLRNRIRALIGRPFRKRMVRAKDRFLDVAKTSCRETQTATRHHLLALNADSQFSKEHGLISGLTVAEYRQRLPVSDYETFRSYIDRMQTGEHSALLGSKNKLLMYAITSGTTSQPKLIPVTRQFLADYRRGWQHWGITVIEDHAELLHLRMVQISSNHCRWKTVDGTPCGNISGLVTSMQKAIVRKLYVIPAAVAKIDDAFAKQYTVLRLALEEPWVGMFVTANPSTLLQLCHDADVLATDLIRDIHDGTLTTANIPGDVRRALRRHLKPNRSRAQALEAIVRESGRLLPSAVWPHLTCLGVWSGGSAGAYVPELRQQYGDIHLRDHGLHASEGRMTIPFAGDTSSGLLDIESHFFEFMPVAEADSRNPVVLEAHELERDREYFILLTTSSGLYRYNIRDVVRCTGFFGTTPLLEFRHKGSHISSITGEKITESQVIEAVRHACDKEQLAVRQFTLTPVWGKPPGYTLFVGWAADAATDDWSRLAYAVDRQLAQINCEYLEKRDSGRLSGIVCESVSDADWQKWKETRLASSGGSVEQYKHPCLLPDPGFDNQFRSAIQDDS